MAILTVRQVVKAGSLAAPVAATGGGDSFPNTGNELLRVINGGGGSINVTIPAQNPCSFGAIGSNHDIVVAVAAGATKDIGPIDPKEYNDANGRAQITYSGVTTVTVEAIGMGRA